MNSFLCTEDLILNRRNKRRSREPPASCTLQALGEPQLGARLLLCGIVPLTRTGGKFSGGPVFWSHLWFVFCSLSSACITDYLGSSLVASAGGRGQRERQPHWAVTRHMCPHAYQAGTAMASSSSRLLSVPLSVCVCLVSSLGMCHGQDYRLLW